MNSRLSNAPVEKFSNSIKSKIARSILFIKGEERANLINIPIFLT